MDLKVVLGKLETYSDFCIQWFENNFMKLNTDKCYLLVSGHKYENCWVRIRSNVIWENSQVKLLGVIIDNQLKFDKPWPTLYTAIYVTFKRPFLKG